MALERVAAKAQDTTQELHDLEQVVEFSGPSSFENNLGQSLFFDGMINILTESVGQSGAVDQQ